MVYTKDNLCFKYTRDNRGSFNNIKGEHVMRYVSLESRIYFKLKQAGKVYLNEQGVKVDTDNDGVSNMTLAKFMRYFGGENIRDGFIPYIDVEVQFAECDLWTLEQQQEYENIMKAVKEHAPNSRNITIDV